MKGLLIYLLKANVLLIVCMSIYHFLLRNLTFHQWKRAYLLTSIAIIVNGPALVWNHHTTIQLPTTSNSFQTTAAAAKQIDAINKEQYLNYLYITILCILMIGILKGMRSLYKSIISLKRIQQQAVEIDKASRIFHHPMVAVAFSTWRNIYLNKDIIANNDLETIILHEKYHISQFHSIDKWLLNIMQVLFWYQPVMKYFVKSVNENNEWIVDAYMTNIMNPENYQLKLLQYHQYNTQIDLANQFAISNLKKRILIMNQTKTAKWKLSLLATSFFLMISTTAALAYRNVTTIVPLNNTSSNQEILSDSSNKENKTHQKNQGNNQNNDADKSPIIILDGKQVDELVFIEKIQKQEVASKNILTPKEAIAKYGDKGVNGVIEITLKDYNPNQKPEGFTKIERSKIVDSILVFDPIFGEERLEIIEQTSINNKSENKNDEKKEPIKILIDGEESNIPINKIEPKHIESMDIMKDKNTISIIILKEFKHLYQ